MPLDTPARHSPDLYGENADVLGRIVGGLIDSYFGHIVPVEITFVLLVSVTIFGSLFLPYIAPVQAAPTKTGEKPKSGFLTPLKLFTPRRGNMSLFLLGAGAFFSVLATGYARRTSVSSSIDVLQIRTDWTAIVCAKSVPLRTRPERDDVGVANRPCFQALS